MARMKLPCARAISHPWGRASSTSPSHSRRAVSSSPLAISRNFAVVLTSDSASARRGDRVEGGQQQAAFTSLRGTAVVEQRPRGDDPPEHVVVGGPVRAYQVESLLDGVRGEQHAQAISSSSDPRSCAPASAGWPRPQSAELDGTVEVAGHPERHGSRTGRSARAARVWRRARPPRQVVARAGPHLRGQAEPELAVQVRGERTARRVARAAHGAGTTAALSGAPRRWPAPRGSAASSHRLRVAGRLGVQQVQSDGLHVGPFGGQQPRRRAGAAASAHRPAGSEVERVRHQRVGQREPVIGSSDQDPAGHQSVGQVARAPTTSRPATSAAWRSNAPRPRTAKARARSEVPAGSRRELELHGPAHLLRAERREPGRRPRRSARPLRRAPGRSSAPSRNGLPALAAWQAARTPGPAPGSRSVTSRLDRVRAERSRSHAVAPVPRPAGRPASRAPSPAPPSARRTARPAAGPAADRLSWTSQRSDGASAQCTSSTTSSGGRPLGQLGRPARSARTTPRASRRRWAPARTGSGSRTRPARAPPRRRRASLPLRTGSGRRPARRAGGRRPSRPAVPAVRPRRAARARPTPLGGLGDRAQQARLADAGRALRRRSRGPIRRGPRCSCRSSAASSTSRCNRPPRIPQSRAECAARCPWPAKPRGPDHDSPRRLRSDEGRAERKSATQPWRTR